GCGGNQGTASAGPRSGPGPRDQDVPVMKVLVIGGSGMVGHVVANHLVEKGMEVVAVSRRTAPGVRSISIDLADQREKLVDELSAGDDAVLNFAGVFNTEADHDPACTILRNSWCPHWLKARCDETD